ncbi:hypothetical protein JL720_4400 [Aureococcus anophagefferens]|nr:hypothetical protein JL720_4400 [Aureococcus anophagefferens]
MVRTCYECGWKSDDITYHVMNSVQVACCTQCATPIPLSAHVKPETGAINVSAAPGKPVVIDLADSDDDEARQGAAPPAAPRRARRPPLKGVKPEAAREARPSSPKEAPADDDGDVPLFSLKKKVSARRRSAAQRGGSSGGGEPPPPPPQRADFAAWLAEREKSGVPALDADQRRACDAVVRDGKNVFVTGSGGNGKSHVTRTILDFFGEHYGDMYGQRVAVCAPTGIAATHVNGTTIHSATGIGVPKCNEDFRRMHQGFRKELWTKLVEVLVIDEISMLSGEWFDNLDRTLRELAHWRASRAPGAVAALRVPDLGPPLPNIPPYITEDEIRHALETCDFIKYNKLIEPMVDLKPGCRVLLLKNIDTRNEAKKEQPLVNGTTGRMPLKLGYAVTIHKSQGMSLDHATISTSGCFAEGQAYVALSRVTGAKALALARPLKGVDVKTPKLSKTFYDLCDALAKEAEDLGGADALGMGPVALRGVLEGMPPSAARDRALEIVANLDPSLDQDAPGVLHWQTKKPSVAREEYGGSGVGSTSKGKAGRCYSASSSATGRATARTEHTPPNKT